MIKDDKELNDVVCAAYKMGCDQTREVYQASIEKLEADLEIATMKRLLDSDRIEELENALREMLSKCTWQKREQWCGSIGCHCQIARKALEGKDE